MLCGVALGACVKEPRTAERAVLALATLGSVAMTALAVPPRCRKCRLARATAMAWLPWSSSWDAGLWGLGGSAHSGDRGISAAQIPGPRGSVWRGRQRAPKLPTLAPCNAQVLASPAVASTLDPDALYACLLLCMALSGAATVGLPG